MPELPERVDGELLGRYLAGECSESETAVVRRYLMAHPDDARVLELFLARLDGVGEVGTAGSRAPEAAASWRDVFRRMHEADRGSARGAGSSRDTGDAPEGAVRWRGTMRRGGRADAVHRGDALQRGGAFHRSDAFHRTNWRRALVIAGCASAAAWAGVVYERSSHHTEPVVPARRTYATLTGERAELRLSDGTRVRLAPASLLGISTQYGTDRRDVYLDGEGYFDVVHDERKPFTVIAGNVRARDLGTTFAVRNYPEDHGVQVVVRAGEVALSGVGRLGAGDLGHLSADGRASIRHGVNVTQLLGWLDGTLSFVDAPLGQVLKDMHRWYDVDVKLGDATLASLPFTGTLADLSPSAAVDLVAATLGLEVRRAGAGITLLASTRAPHKKP